MFRSNRPSSAIIPLFSDTSVIAARIPKPPTIWLHPLSSSNLSFSPSGQNITYMIDDERRLEIFDMLTGNHITVYDGVVPWVLSWLGWVP